MAFRAQARNFINPWGLPLPSHASLEHSKMAYKLASSCCNVGEVNTDSGGISRVVSGVWHSSHCVLVSYLKACQEYYPPARVLGAIFPADCRR